MSTIVWLLNSQGMKNCKSTESFCISIIFTQMIRSLKLWHVHCCHVYFFCSARFLNMCKPRTTIHLFCWACPPGLAFYGSVVKCLLSWIGMVNAGWLTSIYQRFSWEWNLSFFKTVPQSCCPFTWAARCILLVPYSATFACSKILFRIKCSS